MDKQIAWLLAVLLMCVCGCTSNMPHRTLLHADKAPVSLDSIRALAGDCQWSGEAPPPGPAASDNRYVSRPECQSASIETTARYALFFVEFDEQGRLYENRQYSQLFKYLAGRIECGADLSVVVFVHGWRHNSSTKDSNVDLAREVLSFAYDAENSGSHPNASRDDRDELGKAASLCAARKGPREVVGVYVGWRGKSMDGGELFPSWELPSVFDRKNTAENVAIGSARELFSRLRVFQLRQNINEDDCVDKNDPFQCKRVRMMIIGHSFGGLLVYNAVSASIMDSLNQGADVSTESKHCQVVTQLSEESKNTSKAKRPSEFDSATVRSFADLIVLINPAVEGARFEPLHQALQRRLDNYGFCRNQKPVLIVVTAANDFATHYAFQAVRFLSTLLESNTPTGLVDPDAEERMRVMQEEEHDASINAVGHVLRYQTHSIVASEKFMAANPSVGLSAQCTGPRQAGLAGALQSCRCGETTWVDYLKRARAQGESRDGEAARNCPAYVEEINSARYMRSLQSAREGAVAPNPIYGGQAIRRGFCGGPVLTLMQDFVAKTAEGKDIDKPWARTVVARNSPVWIVKSEDPRIVDEHNGINQFPLKAFLKQVYHDISVRDFETSFEKVEKDAEAKYATECAAL